MCSRVACCWWCLFDRANGSPLPASHSLAPLSPIPSATGRGAILVQTGLYRKAPGSRRRSRSGGWAALQTTLQTRTDKMPLSDRRRSEKIWDEEKVEEGRVCRSALRRARGSRSEVVRLRVSRVMRGSRAPRTGCGMEVGISTMARSTPQEVADEGVRVQAAACDSANRRTGRFVELGPPASHCAVLAASQRISDSRRRG